MNLDWQFATALLCVAAATTILVRRVWNLVRSGTGGCGSCGSGCGPPVVSLDDFRSDGD